jgi:hypothetical protein
MTSGGPGEGSVEVPQRADPRKAFRGPASACLSLQAMILPFALFVMDRVEGGLTTVKVVWVVALVVGMIVAIAFFSRPWGLPLALALQVATVLGWVVSPSLGALGVVFALVWALMLWMRREVVRRQAAWPDVQPDPPGGAR